MTLFTRRECAARDAEALVRRGIGLPIPKLIGVPGLENGKRKAQIPRDFSKTLIFLN